MQAVKLDGHTLCKVLDSCQEDKKEGKGITLRWTNRKKFKKKINPRRIQHAS